MLRISRNSVFTAAMATAICASSFAPAGAVNYSASQTIKAGTKIACVTGAAFNSANAKYGDTFELRVVDTSHPVLEGSNVLGYITDVRQPSGVNRARVGFWLTSIRLTNGKKKTISAFVVSKRVVAMNAGADYASHQQMQPVLPVGTVTPGPIAWQMRIGGGDKPQISNHPSGLLGGYIYATNSHETIMIPAGQSVTVQLQQDLTIP